MSAFIPASGGGGSGGIKSIVQGANIVVDNTDPANPVLNLASPLVFASNAPFLENGSNQTIISIDTNGNPVIQDLTGGSTFQFGAGPNPKVTGANIVPDGTTTPVTSVTMSSGFMQAIS